MSTTTTRVDWQRVFDAVDTADLAPLVEADLGPPVRPGVWACPLHPDPSGASLKIDDAWRRWRCWSPRCGRQGNALDWFVARHGCGKAEAALRLLEAVQALADADSTEAPSDAPRVAQGHARPRRTQAPRLQAEPIW